ncbi:MAG: hypothetical protein QNJ72_34385 [Pleurocapsa sp. MO_226.B13]|nr:hypothetical protein [Pleurocapsa sp. MO_226.B13]
MVLTKGDSPLKLGERSLLEGDRSKSFPVVLAEERSPFLSFPQLNAIAIREHQKINYPFKKPDRITP